jgi:hypothetical protein
MAVLITACIPREMAKNFRHPDRYMVNPFVVLTLIVYDEMV